RRRHTRFSRDWGSDVCSSDLNKNARVVEQHLDVGNGEGANDGGRQERNGEIAHEGQLDRVASERSAHEMQQPFSQYPDDRHDRTKLDDDFEDRLIAGGKIDPGSNQQQAGRTILQDKFAESLNDAKQES